MQQISQPPRRKRFFNFAVFALVGAILMWVLAQGVAAG